MQEREEMERNKGKGATSGLYHISEGRGCIEVAGCMLDFSSPGVLLLLQSVVFHGSVLP